MDEVVFGCANQAGENNRNLARMAVLLSRLSVDMPALTVNRLCAWGLDAVIADGVDSMSHAPFVMPKAEAAFARAPEVHDTAIGWRFVNQRIARLYGIESMPD